MIGRKRNFHRLPIQLSLRVLQQLGHGEAMEGYLEVDSDCLTLSDNQRSAISQRIFDVVNISYCGATRFAFNLLYIS